MTPVRTRIELRVVLPDVLDSDRPCSCTGSTLLMIGNALRLLTFKG